MVSWVESIFLYSSGCEFGVGNSDSDEDVSFLEFRSVCVMITKKEYSAFAGILDNTSMQVQETD